MAKNARKSGTRKRKNRRNNSARDSSKRVKNSAASAAEGIEDHRLKAFEFAQVNSDAAFDFAKQLMSATSPLDMVRLWTTYLRKHFEVLSEQTKELGMFGPMTATEMARA